MTVPYVVGQWVRGERFYGRAGAVAALLGEERAVRWVVGTRRVGKTSLLRQVELLAGDPGRGVLALYWDLQGVETPADLDDSLGEALRDAGAALDAVGLTAADLAGRPVAAAVELLAAAARRHSLALLLLADEAEDLLALLVREPGATATVLAALTRGDGVRLVLASSPRLGTLAGRTPEGRALLEAAAPLVLGGLEEGDASDLLRQTHLPAGVRPALGDGAVALLAGRCGGHPFLLQLGAKRAIELGDAGRACEQLAAEDMLGYVWAADMALLEDADRRVVEAVARCGDTDTAPQGVVRRLEGLGLLRRGPDGTPEAGNWFLGRWLAVRS